MSVVQVQVYLLAEPDNGLNTALHETRNIQIFGRE